MPRRDGEVFLLGTAITGPLGVLRRHRPKCGTLSKASCDADKAALIEDGMA
jgi:hypothetical protein